MVDSVGKPDLRLISFDIPFILTPLPQGCIKSLF